MPKLVRVAVVLTMFAGLTGCDTQTQELAATIVGADILAKAGLNYYWTWQVPLNDGQTLVNAWLLDENLYLLTSDNRLMALDAAKGWVKWSHQVARPGKAVFRPAHPTTKLSLTRKVPGMKEINTGTEAGKVEIFDGVVINTVGYALVLDRTSGELYRKIEFSFAANTGAASDGAYLFVGSTRGWFYCLRIRGAVKAWQLSTDDMMVAPPVSFSGRLFVSSTDKHIYAVVVGLRGRKIWRVKLAGPVTAPFHVDERGCFVACEDNRVYAFDVDDGSTLWQPFVCQGSLRSPIQVGQTSLFQYAEGDRLYALDVSTGRKRWALEAGRQVLAVIDGDVYVRDRDNNLLIANEILGRPRASVPLTGLDLFVDNVLAPAAYAASRGGKVVCIRPTGVPRLTAEILKNPLGEE